MKAKLPMGSEWSIDTITLYDKHIKEIADEMGLDYYTPQYEIISDEQMLDAYCSVGLPLLYNHWSFGKSFVQQQHAYKTGRMGLAYEIVINSDPCIAYLMSSNSLALQALVIAHAAYGHSNVFKTNYLFKERTRADTIVDYCAYAKEYVYECEQKYGVATVERFLDLAHSLQDYGVDMYKRASKKTKEERRLQAEERALYRQARVNDFWDTVAPDNNSFLSRERQNNNVFPEHPEENFLYFFEKHAPNLEVWQREILRIVRKIAEYFYPQRLTKVLNEGRATFIHYTILNEMADRGLVDEGFMLEVLSSHTNVVYQPSYDSKYFSGINPYALGFAMFQDIRRMCEKPTKEDEIWFPDIVGKDWKEQTQWAVSNFKDETFIQQYLSPKVMRDMKLFACTRDMSKPYTEVVEIHNEEGYRNLRNLLSQQYDIYNIIPHLTIDRVNVYGDRSLYITHHARNSTPLNEKMTYVMLENLYAIWQFPIHITTVFDNTEVDMFTFDGEEFLR